jgi:hypothetical protein
MIQGLIKRCFPSGVLNIGGMEFEKQTWGNQGISENYAAVFEQNYRSKMI